MFDGLLFSIAAVVFFADSLHQCFEVHHFSFGPISDMLEGIFQLDAKIINFILQLGFTFSRNKFNLLNTLSKKFLILSLTSFITVFVFCQEGCELLVIFEFLLFHRDDVVDMLFKVTKVVHKHSLIFHKLINLLVISIYPCFTIALWSLVNG